MGGNDYGGALGNIALESDLKFVACLFDGKRNVSIDENIVSFFLKTLGLHKKNLTETGVVEAVVPIAALRIDQSVCLVGTFILIQ